MNALSDALKARFDATAVTHGITGGYWAGEAKEGTAMPYCIADVPTASLDESYSSVAETVTVDFKVIAVGRRAAIAFAELLATQFRGVVLTVSGGTMFHVNQITAAIPIGPLDADQYGKNVWEAVVSFEFSTN